MKISQPIHLLGAIGFMAIAVSASAQISTPESRSETLALAERFEVVPVESVVGTSADAIDPFHPDAPEAEEPEAVAAQQGPDERVVLKELAERVRPSGVMQFGTSTMLVFGERRLKEGDFLPMDYQGQRYRVEIVRITPRSFTMRLNSQTISKTIQ